MRYQHQVFIAAPTPRVFAFMDDVDREHEWQPGIREAGKDPPGDTDVGTKKWYVSRFMGRRVENTYITTLFRRDEEVVYETTPDSALQARVSLLFESRPGGTRVTMAVTGEPAGALRLVPGQVLERVFRKELESSMNLLKEKLEGKQPLSRGRP